MNWKPPDTEEKWRECLSAYLDGEMKPEEKNVFERFLQENPERLKQLAELRKLDALLPQWEIDTPSPDKVFEEKILPVIQRENAREKDFTPRTFFPWDLRWAFQTAIFLLGVFIGGAIMSMIGRTGRTTSHVQTQQQIEMKNVSAEKSSAIISDSQAEALLNQITAEQLKDQLSEQIKRQNWEQASSLYKSLREQYRDTQALTFPYPQSISWSPDGQSVAFVSPDDTSLWIWDTRTGEAKRLTGVDRSLDKDVQCPKFLPSGKEIILCADEDLLYRVNIEPPHTAALIDKDVSSLFNLSLHGEKLYYLRKIEDRALCVLVECNPNTGEKTDLLKLEEETGFPVPDETGRRIAYSSEDGLILFDRDTGTTQCLFSQEETIAFCPQWITNSTLVFTLMKEFEESRDEMVSDLVLLSLDDKTTRVLCHDVYFFFPLSLCQDRKFIYMTVLEKKSDAPQAARYNLENNSLEILTFETFGAANPVLSPDGKTLAYMINPDLDKPGVSIMDLETRKRIIVWRDEEERLFSAAESFYESGNNILARSSYQDLVSRFPEGDLRKIAYYRLMELYLTPNLYDLDKAFDMLHKAGTDAEMVNRASPLFWNQSHFIAADSPEDWIQAYATEASKEEFKYNTDLPRDLRGLWISQGKERLYIRIDYGSNQDFSGIALQDAMILLDYGNPDSGYRKITETTQWDRGAERRILIRRWYEAAEKSQYDLEILDDKGEVASRFLVSGFAPPGNPLFEMVYVLEDETNSAVYSISKEILDLKKPRKANIQVCTFKGGIESHRKLEKERLISEDGKPVCDVADAFGEENAIARIEKDAQERAGEPAPFVIRGAAGSFETK
ncbi:PD40 domain-containing protein [Candidatus Sumerlaeota bacterium]|nr:PD40 domain-containing protein [Candidatus Sumerlaeota bacterium]